jgi:DNA repair protein SbcC/Rad50
LVLLPQGRFSEFLHAKASDRQDLLVELLAFGIYNTVGQRARERAKRAADRTRIAQTARDELADATEEAENRAATRVQELAKLARTIEDALESLRELKEQAQRSAQQAQDARDEATLLAAVQTPADVPGLACRITEADQLVQARKKQRDAAEEAEIRAQQARDALPDKTRTQMLRNMYGERRELTSLLQQQEQTLAEKQAEYSDRAQTVREAEHKLQQARDEQAHAERSHAAAALAVDLRVGENCPVCLQPVPSLPHHPAPADLVEAQKAVGSADKHLREYRTAHEAAASATAAARNAVEGTQNRIETVSAALAPAPGEAEVLTSLEAITEADETLVQAQAEARTQRTAVSAAEKTRSSLSDEERQAWDKLRSSRDSIVHLGAPAIQDADLAAAWGALADWAQAQHAEHSRRQPDLDAAVAALRQQVAEEEGTLTGLLSDHGITGITDPARAATAVATYQERAANQLAAVKENRKKAAKLDEQVRAHREEEQVAAMLGQLLRANTFERWLCGEALDSLVTEASETLRELSAGQYQLDRDDRNELIVIDYQDAGARRPVQTLSGGETFQASLALALALSHQVIGLSAGMRDLNSMFLDEGFGTLDEDTLETVATTLERLATDSDRMVGVITHVPALAERVPVRFIVSHTAGTSTLRMERV